MGHGMWCDTCKASVTPIPFDQMEQVLDIDQRNTLPIYSMVVFEGPIREAIHTFKYNGNPNLAKSLGYLFEPLGELIKYWDLTKMYLVPVPLHVSRLRQRGYNQSELLAKQIQKYFKAPIKHWVVRTKPTLQQAHLNMTDRKLNVSGAFSASKEVQGKTMVLIDDIFTTGSTLSACAKSLFDAGATNVIAITFARAEMSNSPLAKSVVHSSAHDR